MDKVDFSHGFDNPQNPASFLGAQTLADSRKARNRKTQGSKFSQVLERSFLDIGELGPLRETTPSEETLQGLLDDVRSAGDDLKKRSGSEEILRYKQSVRNFLNYVVKNSYELTEIQGIKKKITAGDQTEWKTSYYHQVQIIDQKLDQLAVEILTKHVTELNLKSRVDEITGLLIDLTVTGKIRERNE